MNSYYYRLTHGRKTVLLKAAAQPRVRRVIGSVYAKRQGSLMLDKEIWDQAEEYANSRIEPYEKPPGFYGFSGVIVTFGVLLGFAMVSGVDIFDRHLYAFGASLGLGFALPYLYVWQHMRTYGQYFEQEYTRLKALKKSD